MPYRGGYSGENVEGGFSYANPQNLYMGSPVQEVKALNEEASKQYDANRKDVDAIDLAYSNLDVRTQDYHIKKAAYEKVRGQIDELMKKGDYQNAKPLVNRLSNEFLKDKTLQGALQSRKKEVDYKVDLSKRLSEGKINEEQYQYGLLKSNQGSKEGISYDEETGSYKGMYSPQTVHDDKSKEIFDEMYKRIPDWKPDSIISANGETYKAHSGVPGAYINVKTGKQVTKDQVQVELIKELYGRGDWRDYLDQERAIEKYKLIGDKDITIDDFKSLNYDTNKIKDLILGVDSYKMDELSTSKSEKDKKVYSEYIKEKEKLDLNNLDKTKLEGLYNSIQRTQQAIRYTSGASEKAAYIDVKDEFLKDEPYLLNLKHKLDKDLEDYKKKLEVPFIVENSSQAITLTKADFDKMSADNEGTVKQINEIEKTYGTDINKMPDGIRNKYSSLQASNKIYKQQSTAIFEDMKNKGVDLYAKTKEHIFDTEDVHIEDLYKFLSSNTVTNGLALTQELKQMYDKWSYMGGYQGTLTTFDDWVKQGDNTRHFADLLPSQLKGIKASTLYNNPVFNKTIEDYTNQVGTSTEEAGYHDIKDIIDSAKEKYAEENEKQLYQINTKVIADDGNEKSPIHQFTKQIGDLAKAGTDFKTNDGKSIPELVSEYNTRIGGAKGTKEGGLKKIEIGDIKTNITTEPITNRFGVTITLPDGTSPIFYPENQENYKTNLKLFAHKIQTTNPNEANDILGHVNFGSLRNEVAALESKPVGGIIAIDLPIRTELYIDKQGHRKQQDFINSSEGKNQKFVIKVIRKDEYGNSIYSLADKSGNTTAFNILFSKNKYSGGKNEFSNMSTLINSLQTINESN